MRKSCKRRREKSVSIILPFESLTISLQPNFGLNAKRISDPIIGKGPRSIEVGKVDNTKLEQSAMTRKAEYA
jgi:hypothetical protein